MENSGRPHRTTQGGRERGAAAADKAEHWRTQDQVRGQNVRADGGQQGKRNQGGAYKASPKKGGQGSLSYLPGGSKGNSPSQRDDLQWLLNAENSGLGREDNWRARTQQQHWKRNTCTQGEGPADDMEQRREDDVVRKPGEHLSNGLC